MQYDAAVIGGGVAGLQAALTLGRLLYKVVLIDEGKPAHLAATHMHNMIGADHMTPEEFYGRARTQLAAYPNVIQVRASVVDATVNADYSYQLIDDAGVRYDARTVLFAYGIRDVLPPIDGIEELWGKQVQHCAYCHGYESRGKSIAVLTPNASAAAMIRMVRHLSPTLHVLLEDGAPDAATAAQWQQENITHDSAPLAWVEAVGDGLRATLADGTAREFGTLFIRPDGAPQSSLPTKLGCTMVYSHIQLDAHGYTGVPGIYAAGDVASNSVGQLVSAMKSGLDAAVAMHGYLRQ